MEAIRQAIDETTGRKATIWFSESGYTVEFTGGGLPKETVRATNRRAAFAIFDRHAWSWTPITS